MDSRIGKFRIDRILSLPDDCIIGILFHDLEHGREMVCFTLEETWKDNGPDSCIPAGTYKAKIDIHYGNPGKKDDYPVWELQNVPGRTQIQIHIGNTAEDTEGCILLGTRYKKESMPSKKNKWNILSAVLNSRLAYDKFMDLTEEYDEIEINIRDLINGV